MDVMGVVRLLEMVTDHWRPGVRERAIRLIHPELAETLDNLWVFRMVYEGEDDTVVWMHRD